MSELYWITVLGNLNFAASVIFIISTFITVVTGISILMTYNDYFYETELETPVKILKVSLWSCVISLLIMIFVPSKSSLCTIYGLGTVLEYVQDNKDIKKIPDNAIKAINKYLENINNE